MYKKSLFSLENLIASYEAIEADLIRFPSLEPDDIRRKIQSFIELTKQLPENDNDESW